MRARRPLAVVLYGALARLLPPELRDDRVEMVAAFAELREDAPGALRRWTLSARSLAALLGVLTVEWLEFAGVMRAPDGIHGRGRGGMGIRNLRYALRTLRKAPAFSLTSILLVGVGVGAVTTIFTLVDHVLLRPLPYPEADRMVALDNGSFQGPFFQELPTVTGVEEWGAAWSDHINLVGEGDPLRIQQARVSRAFFDLFGAHAQRGRLLRADDFGGPDVAVLAAGAWRRIFGADPSVIGRRIELDGQPVTVVGVVEDRFTPPETVVGSSVDLWRPLDWSSKELQRHDTYVLEVAGRLAPGVRIEAVQEAMDGLVARLAEAHDNYRSRDGTLRHIPVVSLAERTVREVRLGLGILMGAVSLLLLVACANVANLFLARALGRTREMAVRRALGAATGALTSQLLVESLVVGIAGGFLGAVLAWGGIRLFAALSPGALPRQGAVAVDLPVLAFAIGVSVLTSLVFGLLPALRSVGRDLADELRGAGRSATAGRGAALVRGILVSGEVALSLVLVAGAALVLQSFLTMRGQAPGFRVADVWTVPLNLPQPDGPDPYLQTMDAVLRQVQEVPGVREAAYALTMPMDRVGGSRCCWSTRAAIPGREEDDALGSMIHPVSVDYFETLGVQIVAGRRWTVGEVRADPVPLVVNQTLALEMAGTPEAALGLSVKLNTFEAIVVGVASDNRHYGLDQDIGNQLYLPIERLPFPIPIGTLAVHVDPSASRAMPSALRAAVWAAVPSLPVPTVRSMQDAVDASTAERRFMSVVFGAFAAIALLLAAGGLYGTLLYLAGQRKRELGIRFALGASRGRIEAQLVRAGVALAVVGLLVGIGGAWAGNRLLQGLVWGVEPGDPRAIAAAAVVLFVTATLASWLPARRAGRVDPLETLRAE